MSGCRSAAKKDLPGCGSVQAKFQPVASHGEPFLVIFDYSHFNIVDTIVNTEMPSRFLKFLSAIIMTDMDSILAYVIGIPINMVTCASILYSEDKSQFRCMVNSLTTGAGLRIY